MTQNRKSMLLINPPITRAQREGPVGPVIRNLYFNSPPLGIAHIAGVLEREGHRVGIIDAAVEDLDLTGTIERVRAFAPDVVGLTSTTTFYCNARELAAQLRATLPGIVTILGGPHATSQPEKCLRDQGIDYVCIGEGEFTAVDFLRALGGAMKMEDVQGLAFLRDGVFVKNQPRPYIEDLDVLPFPARHLLPLDRYVPMPNDGPYLPKAAMISSRGCPFPCIFCDHGVFDPSYRSYNAVRIVDEMQDLVARYGTRDIAFVDSLFMMSSKRVTEICDEIVRRGLKVHWTCTIRANIATREVLQRMKTAGCWRVRVGIESGNDKVLKFIRKQVTCADVRRVVRDAHDLGLHPKGFFIVGHLTETEATIRDSIEFAKSLPLTDITVQINTPMPNAPQWEIMAEYGDMISSDFELFSFWEPVYVPKGLTRERLNELHAAFYREFYFRPVVMWRHLRMLRSLNDVARYSRALALIFTMFVRPSGWRHRGRKA